MWTLAGEDAEVSVDLKVDGQFVTADQGSITATLRDNSGVAMPDWNKAPVPDTDNNQISITIPAALTFLSSEDQMGALYLTLEWKVEGAPYRSSTVIRLAHFTPIQATADGVRNRLGAGEHEIPDSGIDLYAAYFSLLSGRPDTLPAALRSSLVSACLSANNAIEIQAALVQLPALAAKLAQSEAQENTSKTRMKLDIPGLRTSLTEMLDQELNVVDLALSGQESTTVNQLLVVTPTDVITGA